MARVQGKNGLKFTGKIDNLVFCQRGRGTYVRLWVKPKDPKTASQRTQRGRFVKAVAAWHALAPEQKAKYQDKARKRGRTGYNLFLAEQLSRPIP